MTTAEPSTIRRILRDPLLHFVLVGGVLFWVGRPPTPPKESKKTPSPAADEIRVTPTVAENLWQVQRELVGRSLSDGEKKEVIDSYIDDELLLREARRLNLDDEDGRIRRRLIDKMRFLYGGQIPEPGEEDLRSYYESNFEKYVVPAKVSVEHVFYSKEKVADGEQTQQVLTKLNSGMTAKELSQPNWLGPLLRQLSMKDLTQIFGADAAKRIWNLPDKMWAGPLHSLHGTHFFRATERLEEQLPQFESLVGVLASDWKHERRQRILDQKLIEIKRGYRVVVDPEVSGTDQ